MTQKDELIAKLEAAAEGSRELDFEIEAVVLQPLSGKGLQPPRYTTSIDAALTLVPNGWHYQIIKWRCGLGRKKAIEVRLAESGAKYFDEPTAAANTPALALCIAALKARKP